MVIQEPVVILEDKIRVKAMTGIASSESVSVLFEDIASLGIVTNKFRIRLILIAIFLVPLIMVAKIYPLVILPIVLIYFVSRQPKNVL